MIEMVANIACRVKCINFFDIDMKRDKFVESTCEDIYGIYGRKIWSESEF